MARVVSTEREGIGAGSEAVSHRLDHAGVADNPPGPLLLCTRMHTERGPRVNVTVEDALQLSREHHRD